MPCCLWVRHRLRQEMLKVLGARGETVALLMVLQAVLKLNHGRDPGIYREGSRR